MRGRHPKAYKGYPPVHEGAPREVLDGLVLVVEEELGRHHHEAHSIYHVDPTLCTAERASERGRERVNRERERERERARKSERSNHPSHLNTKMDNERALLSHKKSPTPTQQVPSRIDPCLRHTRIATQRRSCDVMYRHGTFTLPEADTEATG